MSPSAFIPKIGNPGLLWNLIWAPTLHRPFFFSPALCLPIRVKTQRPELTKKLHPVDPSSTAQKPMTTTSQHHTERSAWIAWAPLNFLYLRLILLSCWMLNPLLVQSEYISTPAELNKSRSTSTSIFIFPSSCELNCHLGLIFFFFFLNAPDVCHLCLILASSWKVWRL